MEIVKEILKDDYVKLGKRKFKFNTLPYWVVRAIQGASVVAWVYVMYLAMWLILGGI